MTLAQIFAVIGAVGWSIAALSLPTLRQSIQAPASLCVVLSWIPILGLVTLSWGSLAGASSLFAGLLLLMFQPLRTQTSKRPEHQRRPQIADQSTLPKPQ